MSMLADPRRKQKISVDPRNLAWKNDTNKFGSKMMKKMGWTEGKGLGSKEHGNVDFIQVKLKSDTRGVGCSRNYANNWIAHQDDFNDLLANLNGGNDSGSGGNTSDAEPQHQVQKLEEKGRSSKGRVHYMKFAKGKDLSMKSKDDLACIFGKRKSAIDTPESQSEANSEDERAVDKKIKQQEEESGVQTFTSGTSYQDYFAQKMAAIKKMRDNGERMLPAMSSDPRVESEDDEPRTGFGFSLGSLGTFVEEPSASSCNIGLSAFTKGEELNSITPVEGVVEQSPEEEREKRKRNMKEDLQIGEEQTMANGAEVVEADHSSKKKKKKKKSKDQEKEEPLQRSHIDNEIVDPGKEESSKKKRKKKSKDKEKEEPLQQSHTENETVDYEIEESSKKKKKKKKKSEIEEPVQSTVASECSDDEPKKKKKKKSKKVEDEKQVDNTNQFVVENRKESVLEDQESETEADTSSEKKKKKSKRKAEDEVVYKENDESAENPSEKKKKSKKRKTNDEEKPEDDSSQQEKSSLTRKNKKQKLLNGNAEPTSLKIIPDTTESVIYWTGTHATPKARSALFKGSNFGELKGYGHPYPASLTTRPSKYNLKVR